MTITDFEDKVKMAADAGWEVHLQPDWEIRRASDAEETSITAHSLYCFVKRWVYEHPSPGSFPYMWGELPKQPYPLTYHLKSPWKIPEADCNFLTAHPPIFDDDGNLLPLRQSLPDELGVDGAAIVLEVDPTLVEWLTRYAFNGRKLGVRSKTDIGTLRFEKSDVEAFRDFMDATRWPGEDRKDPPAGVQRYLIREGAHRCQLCRLERGAYQWVHVEPWADTRNHSPHNLLRGCPNCHSIYGRDVSHLTTVKREATRAYMRALNLR